MMSIKDIKLLKNFYFTNFIFPTRLTLFEKSFYNKNHHHPIKYSSLSTRKNITFIPNISHIGIG